MKKIASVLTILVASILIWSCSNNASKRIVSEVPIKTEVLGLKLCDVSSEGAIEWAITRFADKEVLVDVEKVGVGVIVRVIPIPSLLRYGGFPWSYVDVILNEDRKIVSISIVASYENIERAKEQFDAASQVFTQKYGKGNFTKDNQAVLWTDETNSIGLTYEESSDINGNDRSFCTLYYVNIELSDALNKANTPDV